MQKTIGNVALLLVISSSLPALVRVLGLTRFESAGPYENFHMLKNGYWVNMGFRISVLITSVFAILDYYVLGSLQLARRSMSHDGDEHEWNNNIQLAPPHPIHPHHPGNNYGFYVNGPLYPLYVNHDSEELLVIGKVNDGYPNGYVNGYIIGDGNGVTNDQSEESMHFYKDEYANGHTNGYTNGYAHGYENGHVSTEENGYINGYPMNGYLNGHINGYADTHER
ncbi:hypothetical protein G9A89_016796 [Geosiphon pyriformis]|nr:hypothetical protein G9A89_016796 [Geosiphon pyriformis]